MKKLRLAVIALVVSLFANILCILPYIDGYYERIKEYIYPTQYFSASSSDTVVINAVVGASMEMDGDMFITQCPNMGLIPDFKRFVNYLGGVNNSVLTIIQQLSYMPDYPIILYGTMMPRF